MATVTPAPHPPAATRVSESHPSSIGEPVYELAARLFPRQGEWTLEQYHDLIDNDENLRVEFVDGCLEFLPVPSDYHEDLSLYLAVQLFAFLGRRHVRKGGYELTTPTGRARFPDVLASSDRSGFGPSRATTADLIIEIVSPGQVQWKRDHTVKRRDYADAGVSEYWIVDPQTKSVLQLQLVENEYEEVGKFVSGQVVACRVFDGFAIAVDELFATTE